MSGFGWSVRAEGTLDHLFKGFGIGKADDFKQAQWLSIKMGRKWRYDHGHGRWHEFRKPGIWFPDTTEDVLQEVARFAAHDLTPGHASSATSEEARKALTKLLNITSAGKALQALRTFPEHKTDGDDWDRNPYLLGCTNGVVDLRTGTLRPGNPGDLVTRSTGIAYNPKAECPQTLAFMNEVLADFDGKARTDLFTYVMLVFGAALFGHTKPQQFWLFIGPGGAGKGTLARLICHALGGGDQYATFPASTLYTAPKHGSPASDRARADLMNLQGRRLAYISEPEGPFHDLLLLNHSGEDDIMARSLFSNRMVSFPPTHTIIFSSNNPPAIKEVGVNMRRRLRVVPFVRTFGDHPDTGLLDRLKGEAEGVLYFLVRAAGMYHEDPGVLDFDRAPEAVKEASQSFIDANDPLAGFIRDRCILNPKRRTPFRDLFEAYQQWHARSGQEGDAMTETAFGRALKDAHQHLLHMERVGESRTRSYVGIGLQGAPGEDDEDEDA